VPRPICIEPAGISQRRRCDLKTHCVLLRYSMGGGRRPRANGSDGVAVSLIRLPIFRSIDFGFDIIPEIKPDEPIYRAHSCVRANTGRAAAALPIPSRIPAAVCQPSLSRCDHSPQTSALIGRKTASLLQQDMRADVEVGSTAVRAARKRDFRFTPNIGHGPTGSVGPVRANNRHQSRLHKRKAASALDHEPIAAA
jgi:hypothetical protein